MEGVGRLKIVLRAVFGRPLDDLNAGEEHVELCQGGDVARPIGIKLRSWACNKAEVLPPW